MSSEKKSVHIVVDAEINQRLQEAATKKGVSVEQYCSDAICKELDSEVSDRKVSLKGMIATGETIFRGRLSVTDSADLIREAREERHRDSKDAGSS